ncbi:MAG TPA: hypothetical protein VK614_05580 [Allosphingosinicella sp.]|nr:hypothetical protein [Allosphingosinicella sp.]
MGKLTIFAAAATAGFFALTGSALAGIGVPAPEAGVGLGSMALIGSGYLYLKRRITRC